MTETMEVKALAIVPKTITELVSLAELLAKSDLLPKALRGKVPDVAMTIMAGQEMGFTPMAALRNFHVIDGKPVLSASGKVALVRASGKCKYFDCVEETDERVTYETMRFDSTKPQRATWTKQRAKDAGLNTKDNWRLFGLQMLHARAKSELCEKTYEDVIGGTATLEIPESWGEMPERNADAVDAEIVNETVEEVTLPPEFDAIEASESVDACKALLTGALKEPLAKLTQAQKRLANERYKSALKVLRERERQGAA